MQIQQVHATGYNKYKRKSLSFPVQKVSIPMSTLATRFPHSHSLLTHQEPVNINNEKSKSISYPHLELTGSFQNDYKKVGQALKRIEYGLIMTSEDLSEVSIIKKLFQPNPNQSNLLYTFVDDQFRVQAPSLFIQKIRAIYFVLLYSGIFPISYSTSQTTEINQDYETTKKSLKISQISKKCLFTLKQGYQLMKLEVYKSDKIPKERKKYLAEFSQFLRLEIDRANHLKNLNSVELEDKVTQILFKNLNKYPIIDEILIELFLLDFLPENRLFLIKEMSTFDDNHNISHIMTDKLGIACQFRMFREFVLQDEIQIYLVADGFCLFKYMSFLESLEVEFLKKQSDQEKYLDLQLLDVSRIKEYSNDIFHEAEKSFIHELQSVTDQPVNYSHHQELHKNHQQKESYRPQPLHRPPQTRTNFHPISPLQIHAPPPAIQVSSPKMQINCPRFVQQGKIKQHSNNLIRIQANFTIRDINPAPQTPQKSIDLNNNSRYLRPSYQPSQKSRTQLDKKLNTLTGNASVSSIEFQTEKSQTGSKMNTRNSTNRQNNKKLVSCILSSGKESYPVLDANRSYHNLSNVSIKDKIISYDKPETPKNYSIGLVTSPSKQLFSETKRMQNFLNSPKIIPQEASNKKYLHPSEFSKPRFSYEAQKKMSTSYNSTNPGSIKNSYEIREVPQRVNQPQNVHSNRELSNKNQIHNGKPYTHNYYPLQPREPINNQIGNYCPPKNYQIAINPEIPPLNNQAPPRKYYQQRADNKSRPEISPQIYQNYSPQFPSQPSSTQIRVLNYRSQMI